jgi:tetratricopeptide (TPR) repeat protein
MSSFRKFLFHGLPVRAHLQCPMALALALLAGSLQGADPVMEAYSRACALNGQITTRGLAIEQLKSFIETNPGFWRAYKALARAYVVAGQVAQGESYFRKLIVKDQANAYANFGLGTLLYEVDRYEEASEQLSLCARKNPNAYACYATLPDAMKGFLKRPASLKELEARVPQFSSKPSACVGMLEAQVQMRNMQGLGQGLATCLKTAKASGDPDFEPYVIRMFNDADANAEAEVGRLWELLRAATARGDVEWQLHALGSLGRKMEEKGHPEKAEHYLGRAVALARSWGTQEGLQNVLNESAAVYKLRGNMEQAIRVLVEAVEPAKATGDAAYVGGLARELGSTYRSAGQLDEAMRSLEEALVAVRSIQNRREEAFLLRDAAMVETDTGDYWKALERMQEAARMFHELGLSWPEGATIGHLPMIYGPLGDYDAALRTARQGLESAYANQDPLMEQRIVEHIGTIYLRLGKPERALPYLERSISLTPQTKAMPLHLNALLSLGEAYAGVGRTEKALASLEEGLATSRKMERPASEAQALDLLGEFWLKRGNSDKAKTFFEQSLAIAERIRVPQLTLAARRGLALVANRRNRPDEEWLHLKPALEAIESVRGRIPTPDLRTHFVEQNAAAYEEAIDALSRMGRDRDALLVAERARARAFLDLLTESKSNLRKGLTSEQERERQRLESKVSQALAALEKDDSEKNRLAASESEAKLAAWHESVRMTNPEYASMRYPQPYTPEQAQRLARERGIAILEFALGERQSHLWVITGSAIRMIRLPPRLQIESVVGAYRAKVARPSLDDVAPISRQLCSMLFGAAEPMLGGARKILIVPDGILHYLPFEALSPQPGRFLVEDFTIVYAPSVSVFASLRLARAARAYDLLAYGDPVFSPAEAVQMRSVYRSAGISLSRLPNTRTEVEEIGALFPPAREKLRLGLEATEA